MPLHGFGRAGASSSFKSFAEPADLIFRFDEMLLDESGQLIRLGCLHHLRQRLYQLFLRVKQITHLVDEKSPDGVGVGSLGRFRLDPAVSSHNSGFLERRGVQDLPGIAFIPGAGGVDLAHVALTGRIVEILVHERSDGADLADRETRLAHAIQRRREGLHVRDLARHEELQRVLRAQRRRRI